MTLQMLIAPTGTTQVSEIRAFAAGLDRREFGQTRPGRAQSYISEDFALNRPFLNWGSLPHRRRTGNSKSIINSFRAIGGLSNYLTWVHFDAQRAPQGLGDDCVEVKTCVTRKNH